MDLEKPSLCLLVRQAKAPDTTTYCALAQWLAAVLADTAGPTVFTTDGAKPANWPASAEPDESSRLASHGMLLCKFTLAPGCRLWPTIVPFSSWEAGMNR